LKRENPPALGDCHFFRKGLNMEPSQMEDVLAYVDREMNATEEALKDATYRTVASERYRFSEELRELKAHLDEVIYDLERRVTDLEESRFES
jgi:hypothetical protein